jgi:hypothetical protein
MRLPGRQSGPGGVLAEASPGLSGRSAEASEASSGRILVLLLAATLLVSTLAQMRAAAPGAGEADLRIVPDEHIAVVLCVLDAAGEARCHGKDGVLTGAVDGRRPSVCGMADRPLNSPCASGEECVFHRVAPRGEVLGLIVLEPRPPLFGVPRHRLVDATVLSPSAQPAPLTTEMARAVVRTARCLAPSGDAPETQAARVLLRHGCADGPCRLRNSSMQLVLSAARS